MTSSMPAADVTNLGSFAFYTGMIGFTLDVVAPPGWVLLQTGGSTALIADHPNLAQLLGTRYGGDGVTTFGLPPAEYVLAGPSGAHALWSLAGEETHTLTSAEVPATPIAGQGNVYDVPCANTGYQAVLENFSAGNNNRTSESASAALTVGGGGGAHNNLQPTHRVNVIVKD